MAGIVSRNEIGQLLVGGGGPLMMYEGPIPEITRRSFFFYAAALGFHDVLRLWAEDKNVLTQVEAATLDAAVQAGDIESIQILLNAGMDPDSTDPKGITPLMTAIACERSEAVALLLGDARTNIQRQNWQGQDAMTVAIMEGDEEAVMALLDRGYDVEAWKSRQSGITSLELARRVGNDHIVSLLEAANRHQKSNPGKVD